jgi:hypothetical protein
VNEAKQKAAQEVVEVARAVLHGAKLSDAMVDEWIIKGEDGRALWSALRRIGMSPDCYLTTDSSKPFADERAKVGDVVMHKHNSPGLHMCAVEGVHLAVEEVTDRYVSVRGDGVRSKWIRIDHGWYEIVKRAEEKRIPQVGEFWRMTNGSLDGHVGMSVKSAFDIPAIRFADGYTMPIGGGPWMEFSAPARKDGEFKAGDRVLFCDREWIAIPDSEQDTNGIGPSLRIHLPPDAKESKPGQFCPRAYAPIGMVTLKVPVEMRG